MSDIKCIKCGSTNVGVLRDMKSSRQCLSCHSFWLPIEDKLQVDWKKFEEDRWNDLEDELKAERARRLDAEEALSVYADKSRYAYETANGWNYMWNDQGHIARAHFEKYKDEK